MRKNNGFTLIELLVVITIISMLASIVLASVNQARARARDVVRLSDMKQLQNAFEAYYTVNNQYLPNPNSAICSTCVESGWTTGELTPHMRTIPKDPLYAGTTNGYRYIVSNVNGRQSYSMLVRLEKNPTWCSVSTSPGHSAWNFSNGSTYPRCY